MNDEEQLCNLCGLTTVVGPKGGPATCSSGLIDACVVGGYESTPGNGHGALDDMCAHKFSLCEWCLDWLFSRFKVPVTVYDPMNDYAARDGESQDDAMKRLGGWVSLMTESFDVPAWKPAEQRVSEDEWRSHLRDEFFC